MATLPPLQIATSSQVNNGVINSIIRYLQDTASGGGGGGGTGTVTSVSVTTANGVSGSVANATTTPAITLSLGAITPTSVAASGTVTGSNLSGTNTGDQTITLTGNVTGSGTGSFAATIANDAVTYAKMQNISAASKLLGRGSAGGGGDVEEITLGSGLSMTGTTLSASGGGGGVTGDGLVGHIAIWTGVTPNDPTTEIVETDMTISGGVFDIPEQIYCGSSIEIAPSYFFQSGYYSGDILGLIEADEDLGTWTFKSIYGKCVIGDAGPVDYNGTENNFLNTVTTKESDTFGAGINLPHGVAPTSPNDGDMWTTSAGLFVRINGTTYGTINNGLSVTITTAQLTTLGSQGSMTFTNGQLTAQTAAT